MYEDTTDTKEAETDFRHEDEYLKRFEDEFRRIRDEISLYSVVIPQYKNENESLRERLKNIREWVENASKMRYLPSYESDTEAVLASLITNILIETDNLDELKPIIQKPQEITETDRLFQLIGHRNNIEMDEAFSGFDFFENNPYKKAAEKKIAKYQKRKKK